MKFIYSLTFATLMLIGFGTEASAQCKSYAKRQCKPALAPFLHNGQLNNAVLVPGDKAELLLTFFSGQEYRLMICAMPVLGKVTFRVLDSDRNQIFSSEKTPDKNYFDFKVASTQQLIVEINVPEAKATNDIVPEGCVTVMIGFKK
ncbi:MAG: hypothetical protein K1X56_08595 [Flavobacteriales bacterium]|nr:hypothetical protein [Flavobacteriales bacterium]